MNMGSVAWESQIKPRKEDIKTTPMVLSLTADILTLHPLKNKTYEGWGPNFESPHTEEPEKDIHIKNIAVLKFSNNFLGRSTS
jgi:hypothetical protein